MKFALATILTSVAFSIAPPPCIAQEKGKSPKLKEFTFERGGVRVRAMLPESTVDEKTVRSDGAHLITYRKDREGLETLEIAIRIPAHGAFADPGSKLMIPEKDADGKFVEEQIADKAKRMEIKNESVTKIEQSGYVGREVHRKPQKAKGLITGMSFDMPGGAMRMFVVNKTLVWVEYTWKNEAPSKEAIKAFFDSFRIELAK